MNPGGGRDPDELYRQTDPAVREDDRLIYEERRRMEDMDREVLLNRAEKHYRDGLRVLELEEELRHEQHMTDLAVSDLSSEVDYLRDELGEVKEHRDRLHNRIQAALTLIYLEGDDVDLEKLQALLQREDPRAMKEIASDMRKKLGRSLAGNIGVQD